MEDVSLRYTFDSETDVTKLQSQVRRIKWQKIKRCFIIELTSNTCCRCGNCASTMTVSWPYIQRAKVMSRHGSTTKFRSCYFTIIYRRKRITSRTRREINFPLSAKFWMSPKISQWRQIIDRYERRSISRSSRDPSHSSPGAGRI